MTSTVTTSPSKADKPAVPTNLPVREGRSRRVRTPTVIQMEAVECGAAALAIILAHHGRIVPLEELRVVCGVSRDGASAKSIVQAAGRYGLAGRGFRMELDDLAALNHPTIIFWAFQHFLVVEGIRERFGRKVVFVNDPASGPRRMDLEEFDGGYTGIVLTFEKTPEFRPGGRKESLFSALRSRWGRSGGLLVMALLASLLLVVPGIVTPAYTRIFIDLFLTGGTNSVTPLVIAMVFTAAALFVLTAIQQRSFITMYTKLSVTSTPAFFRHLLRLPVEFFLQRQPAELSRRVRANNMVADLLSRDVATTVVSLLLVVFYAAVMLTQDLVLSLIGVLIVALNVLVLRWVARLRTDSVARLRADRGKLAAATINTLRLIETVKASGTELQAFRRWGGFQAKVSNLEQQLGVPTIALTAVPPALATINSGLILLIGGLKAMDGAISVGLLVAFQALVINLSRPVTALTNLGERLQDITADVDRIRDVIAHDVDPVFTRPAESEPGNLHLLTGHVSVQNLTFGYGPLSAPVLTDLSFSLQPGRRTALVGDSGSGKSTVGRIVAGTYRARSGRILFDGVERDSFSRIQLAKSVAFVEQDVFLFEGTIRDNLTLWDDTVAEDAVIAALRDADMYDVIARRPGGIDSSVREGGANFSGGQRQRLAIARALVHQPTVLIMDEATSALDGETEQRVDDNLRRRGCACLIIAHRLSTVRDSDEIIVLRAGQVSEQGRHDDLMSIHGEYFRLVTSA
jgi:NHLM bacteriocin system ABC transporter peptidase/ATP-binding protein